MYLRKSLLLFPAVTVFAAVCGAQDPQIQPVPADQKEVVVSGRPGNDATLIGRITLLSSKAAPELLFRPSDLHREGGTETVSRSQIQPVTSGKLTLLENTPLDFDFKVAGLKLPGVYTGSIDFLLPSHGISPAVHLNLKVRVEETPKLSLRSQGIKIQIVNCSLLRCVLGRRLLPNALIDDHSLTLDNGSSLPFKIDGAASATGDVNHHNTDDALDLRVPAEIPPKPIVTLSLQIKNGQLPADHYLGDIQLRVPGKDEPLKIPLEINVKNGPEFPLLVLLIGILFGRLIKYMKDKGTPQSDLLLQLFRLEARARQNPDDEQFLLHMMDQTREEIEQMQLEQAKADVQTIGNRLNLLARLRFLESLLTPRAGDAGVPAILANIAKARNQISLGVDPTPVATQIETAVQNLAPGGGPPGARQQELAVAASVRTAATAVMAAVPPVPPPSKFRSALSFLTGHEDAARAAVTVWFLRPLLYLVLIIVLSFVGLMQLYFKNPIFGADFINDYFGLFVWASSSDVASRTLSTFKGS
ncbi:MAG: hypothetical protein WBL63_12170 [Candidatus Acidiferrum sp.]